MTNPFNLSGRGALVTGAGSPDGIGFATARLLAQMGARVVLSATTDRIQVRASELTDAGFDATGLIADLTDAAAAKSMVDTAAWHLKSLDIVVNNAGMVQTGVNLESGDLIDQPAEAWSRQIDLTLMTAVNTTRAAIGHMRKQTYGSIVMVSSVTGPLVSAAGSSAYSAAKGAMDGLMRAVAIE
jgi:3-oxoacyl-[acyl-carrier protein] reductase